MEPRIWSAWSFDGGAFASAVEYSRSDWTASPMQVESGKGSFVEEIRISSVFRNCGCVVVSRGAGVCHGRGDMIRMVIYGCSELELEHI